MSQPPFLNSTSSDATLSAYTTRVGHLKGRIAFFTEGHCALLAGRIAELTGWEIVALENPEGDHPLPVHYCNRLPDGRLVDARGCYPKVFNFMVARHHGVAAPIWKTYPRMPMTKNDRAMADRFLNTPWGLAIVPRASRTRPKQVQRTR